MGGAPHIGIPTGGRSGGIGLVGILIIVGVLWFSGVFSGGDGGSPTVDSQPSGQIGVPTDDEGRFAAVVLADTEDTWGRIFQEGGKRYQDPTLVLFGGSGQFGLRLRERCGHRAVLLSGRQEALRRPEHSSIA